MAKYKTTQVRERIYKARGRTPIKASFTTKFVETITKSQAGVEYIKYVPTLVKF